MKHRFPLILVAVMTIVTGFVCSTQAQPSLLNTAFNKTKTENFEGALQDLKRAADFFIKQKDWENAYKSMALTTVVRNRIEQRKTLEAGKPPNAAEWYRLGICIGGKDICDYSIAWLTPDTIGTDFDGILVLQKHLRDLPNPEGGTVPVQAIVAAEVVPKLKGGESLNANCSRQGQKGFPIVAIHQTRGFKDADLYTQISRAWQINTATQKIESISPSNVVCVNPCPGEC